MLNVKYFIEREALGPQFSNTSLLRFPSNVKLNVFFKGNVKLGYGFRRVFCLLWGLIIV